MAKSGLTPKVQFCSLEIHHEGGVFARRGAPDSPGLAGGGACTGRRMTRR